MITLCFRPAAQLVRVVLDAHLRGRDVDHLHHIDDFFELCFLPSEVTMILEGLSDLKPDPKKGIEGRRRILRNEGNLISPDLLSLFGFFFQNVLSFEEDFSGNDPACRFGHHSHEGLADDALAAGRFSDQPPHLLLSEP